MATMTTNEASGVMTMTGMSSATSTAMSDMSGMSMMMGMQDMMMVFFQSNNTPLWSPYWIPQGDGQYAGTCVFLVVLAAVFRALLALRNNLLRIYDRAVARRHTRLVTVEDSLKGCENCTRPWRINEAATLALFDTILAGIGYLL